MQLRGLNKLLKAKELKNSKSYADDTVFVQSSLIIIISLLMSGLMGSGLPYGLHIRRTGLTHHAGPVRVGGS
jgi:hypothetical protein